MTDRDYNDRPSPAKLYRKPYDGYIRGVCAGIADYFGVKAWHIRLATLILLFMFTMPTVIVYIILAFWLEPEPEHLYEDKRDETFWRGMRTEPSQTFESISRRFRDLETRLRQIETHVTSPGYDLSRKIDEL